MNQVTEKARLLLVWLGMGHKGENPILPEQPYEMDELRGRCLELREAIRTTETIDIVKKLKSLPRYTHRVCDDGDGHFDEMDYEDEAGDCIAVTDVDQLIKELEKQ